MAVIEDKYLETVGGIRKNIDQESMPLALDILQRGLYAFPIQSTIRELASNARDAIVERDVAKKILSGEEKIEDHFDVEKVDGIYHSSGWDPTYFNTDWLSDDQKVYIYYEEGKLKDKLRIVDHGVGLGKDRLVGFFQLNYSSKRTNKDSLGKWGLGSKVALSLNVPSFRVTTYYEGKKSAFDIYLDKVDPVTPKFSKDGANQSFQLTEGVTAYYETTEEKNGVTIEVDVKKHNKKQFFEAVESQLMYMPDIEFLYRAENNLGFEKQNIEAKVLYKDENVVISESTLYDKPHILLGAGDALINYGFVSFNELEIEPKQGSVGLILNINDIEVTPSREAPVWSTKTRDAVLKKYKDVASQAAKFINTELQSETDYIKWILKAAQTVSALASGNNDSVIGKLASIIDANEVSEIYFPRNLDIKYESTALLMFGDRLAVRLVTYDSGSRKVKRTGLKSLTDLSKPIYFSTESADMFKDRYIYDDVGDFILIQTKDGYQMDPFAKLVMQSTVPLSYKNVVVPEDIIDLYKAGTSEDEFDDDGNLIEDASFNDPNYRAIQRKLNKEIVIHKLNPYSGYVFSSSDISITDINSVHPGNIRVIYGTSADRRDLKNLAQMFPTHFLDSYKYSQYGTSDLDTAYQKFYTPEKPIDMLLVASENKKYLTKRFITPADYVIKSYNKTTGHLEFSDDIKAVVTASVIFKMISDNKSIHFSNKSMEFISKSIYNFYGDFIAGWSASRGPNRQATTTKFYRECIQLQMHELGIISNDKDELLSIINKDLPGIFCENIDEITSVDILFKDELTKVLKDFEVIKPIKGVSKLFCDHYYYSDDLLMEDAKEIQQFIDTNYNRDESVQQ